MSSFEHRAKVAEIVVTGASIITGAWVAARQLTKGQEHEVRIKVHEQRRANYDFFFTVLLDKVLVHQKKIAAGLAPADSMPVTEEEMIELNSKMVRYASSDVLRLWLDFQSLGRVSDPEQGFKGLLKLGEMLAQMRKEIGLEDSKPPSPRQLLGTFITDLHDPQYDELFRSPKRGAA